jgi:pimeloyl-ACP methyl ester carboxylesterase
MKYYDEFCKQLVPRWRSMDDWAQDAYNNLVDCFDGGCVIMAHSQGANFALPAALVHPDKVKGLILLEPARTPEPQTTDFSALKDIPQLILWGDFIRVPELCAWTKAAYFKIYPEYFRIMKELGAPVNWIDLPKHGIFGNTHLLMMDRNSAQVAELIQNWMRERGLM